MQTATSLSFIPLCLELCLIFTVVGGIKMKFLFTFSGTISAVESLTIQHGITAPAS